MIPVSEVQLEKRTVDKTENRENISKKLKEKVSQGEPLIVHAFVPLCDNANQGIVPVNASLGNGQNLRTNLYWGAGYGIRTHFYKNQSWKKEMVDKPSSPVILERIWLKRTYENGAKVFFIADAYDGAYMKNALEDFLAEASGNKKCNFTRTDSANFSITPDLVIFNGHNGLMDEDVPPFSAKDLPVPEAIVIACFAKSYFSDYLEKAGAYPTLCATHLLAPEAYVMSAAIDSWARLGSGSDIREAAAQAYNQYQKCGINGARNLFSSGW